VTTTDSDHPACIKISSFAIILFYNTLRALEEEGAIAVDRTGSLNEYRVTDRE
jgi:hypothetical protein